MKTLLFLLLPLSAEATNISWVTADDITAGHKVYWQMMDDCSQLTDDYMIHSVDVGKTEVFQISDDPNFIPGKIYAFRVSSYNSIGIESDQSDDIACLRVANIENIDRINSDSKSLVKKKRPKVMK